MPGTIVFKPIEAKLTHSVNLVGDMNPYCSFVVGSQRVDSKICNKGGKHPYWNDEVTIPITNESSKIMLEVMDKDKISNKDVIATCLIDLKEVITHEKPSRWYPLSYKNKTAGEILMEINYKSEGASIGQEHSYKAEGVAGLIQEKNIFIQPVLAKEEMIKTKLLTKEKVLIDQVPDNKVFIEQREVVEPRTFLKEVDVVETRTLTQEIEVMEPTKVLKEVQYTKVVPVEKEIEVVEPKVVMKEIEVIEPRVVTKTIQVVENVPVKKEVEVIESVTRIEKTVTMEPQTFTKQVEVIEQLPVKKVVEVSELVHSKKEVEFVEPIITTTTITKQLQEAVIVDEKITQSTGPATTTTNAILTNKVKLLEQSLDTAAASTKSVTTKSKKLDF